MTYVAQVRPAKTQSRRPRYPALIVTLVALIALSARLARAQQSAHRVAVAAHALVRGAVLTADDIVMRDTTLRGPAEATDVAPGWVTRRVIAAGEILRAPAVEAPAVVLANQSVEVEWKDQDVRLTLRGVVSRNAALGERVSVRTELGRRMDGVVIAPGRVRVD